MTIPVFEFDYYEETEFVFADAFDYFEEKEFETTFQFDYMDFLPSAQSQSHFAIPEDKFLTSCNFIIVPQNLLYGKTITKLFGGASNINHETLRDGCSRIRTPFQLNDGIQVDLSGYSLSFISIVNEVFRQNADYDYQLINSIGGIIKSGTFAGSDYGAYEIWNHVYGPGDDLKYLIVKLARLVAGGGAHHLGEIVAGLWQQPDLGYNEGFVLKPLIIGTDQKSSYGAPAKDCTGKAFDFKLDFQIASTQEVMNWIELFYNCHKHKKISDSHYIAYSVAVIINDTAYLMTMDLEIEIPNRVGDQYTLSLNLYQEGIEL